MSDDNTPYSSREIREKWHDINDSLQEILTQTKLTNGRVRALEKWQYGIIGAIGVLTPLACWMLWQIVEITIQVQAAAIVQDL